MVDLREDGVCNSYVKEGLHQGVRGSVNSLECGDLSPFGLTCDRADLDAEV